ncbi:TIGR02678 family protein [Fundicoccus culcitae]|uniref:TIGR02678 family protein n=1 Tax=Fundicoccus culcitae TaxID=2969821 RepID=A0ABY5P385_9LACT|nr:TIGR02678 family protein [Fundicoccus culcitae]UUX33162.1 TIGR02678 family protein [Fundicoccus culcitae]
MTILESLFKERWILKRTNKTLYYTIRDQVGNYQKFLNEKLGYRVIITPELVKLEKIPGVARAWMGIQDFSTALEYQFFCLVLMFLEDKETGQQFILSELTEFIRHHYPTEPIKWEDYTKRRLLVRVMKYCFQEELIIEQDGTVGDYLSDYEADILYTNTGISRYYMRQLTQSIQSLASLEADDFGHVQMEADRGLLRRQRVYRKLILEPAVKMEHNQDEDYLYIKNYRSVIEHDFQTYFDVRLDIHRNSAYLVMNEAANLGEVFPDRSNLSEIILLINTAIRHQVLTGDWQLDNNDCIEVTQSSFESLISQVKYQWNERFTKKIQALSLKDLAEQIMQRMTSLNFIYWDEDLRQITIFPICGKIVGEYVEGEFDDE